MSALKLVVCFTLANLPLDGQRAASVRDLDFRNWTFPFVRGPGVPSQPLWLRAEGLRRLTVRNGRYDFQCPGDPPSCPGVRMEGVDYGRLRGIQGEVALVTVWYHSGGTASWGYIYVVGIVAGQPRVVGLLRGGSRADQGIREFKVEEEDLIVTLNDPEKRSGACCSDGTITVRYRHVQTAEGAMFVEVGKRVFADLPLQMEVPLR
jgi:hypothetical protein